MVGRGGSCSGSPSGKFSGHLLAYSSPRSLSAAGATVVYSYYPSFPVLGPRESPPYHGGEWGGGQELKVISSECPLTLET